MDSVVPAVSGSVPNPYYAETYLIMFLKNKMAYLPWWSGILNDNVERYSNSHIENFNKQIKSYTDNEKNKIGQMPAKCLRFLKTMQQRNMFIHKQVMLSIPKKRCASSTPKRVSLTKRKLEDINRNDIKRVRLTSDSESGTSQCSVTSIFESKDTEITLSESQKSTEKWLKKSGTKQSPKSYFDGLHLQKLKDKMLLTPINEESITDDTIKIINTPVKIFKKDPKRIDFVGILKDLDQKTDKDYIPSKTVSFVNFVEKDIAIILPLPFLKNGCKGMRNFTATCAFDSFTQSILALTEQQLFLNLWDTKEGDFKSLIDCLRQNKKSEADSIRNKILNKIYPDSDDCTSNILDVVIMFWRNYFPNQSVEFECVMCTHRQTQIRHSIDVDYNILRQIDGIKKLSESITNNAIKECPNCKTQMSFKNTFSPLLTIDVQLLTVDYKTKTIDCSLSSIPNKIFVEGNEYILQSLINYIPGHYTCILKRKNNEWQIYNDLSDDVRTISPRLAEGVHPQVVVYLHKDYCH